MRKLFWLFMLVVLIALQTPFIHAQDGWTVAENCMNPLTYPIIEQNEWDFPGVIITSYYSNDVRALRADLNAQYFIALESDDSFPGAGVLSPDGRYFAYPTGHSQHYVNAIGDSILSVDYVRVVRSDGNTEESYIYPASNYTYSGSIGSLGLPRPIWFGNDVVFYPNIGGEPAFIEFATGEEVIWENTVSPYGLYFVSPDTTRAFTDTLYNLEDDAPLTFPIPTRVVWFPDSSAFIASGEQLTLVDRDGETSNVIWNGGVVNGVAIAPNQEIFAFWDSENHLYLADISQQVIYDLCFEVVMRSGLFGWDPSVQNLAWSPDSTSLAFIYDGYLVLLDVQTFENSVLDHIGMFVMGWGSLDSEVVEQTSVEIRPTPQFTSTPTATLTPTNDAPAPTAVPPTATPSAETCQLEVVVGANLRSGPSSETERVGSAAIGFILTAQAQQFNTTEYFIYWQLTTGEWVREDFVREDENCAFLPVFEEETTP